MKTSGITKTAKKGHKIKVRVITGKTVSSPAFNFDKIFLKSLVFVVALALVSSPYSWVKAVGTDTTVMVGTGTLTVIKNVDNTNGGTKVAGDFTLHLAEVPDLPGAGIVSQDFRGDASGTIFNLAAGPYTVTEDATPGYTASFSDCDFSIAVGQDLTCTVTNTFIPTPTPTPTPIPTPTPTPTCTDNCGGGGTSSFAVNVTISHEVGDGQGVVTGNGLNCDSLVSDSQCSGIYASGTPITLTASARNGSSFTGTWTSGPCATSEDPNCAFILTAPTTLNAHFSLNSGGGCASNCSTPSGGGGGGFGGGGNGILPVVTPTPTPSPSPVPTGIVLGDFTNIPSSGGLQMQNPPQVLGASTTLPRTGVPLSFMLLAFIGALAIVNTKYKLV